MRQALFRPPDTRSSPSPRPETAGGRSIPAAVAGMLSWSGERLDYATAKLALDCLIDSSTDLEAAKQELERLTGNVRQLAAKTDNALAKLGAVRTVLYESGPWNGHRPFDYDHSDPLGTDIANKLLANYLKTRRGNCVSMPVLFLILADRIGLDVSLATAPLHMFVRHRLKDGRIANLETTSGGYPVTIEQLRQSFPMTDPALANGLYLRSLGRHEAVAVMGHAVLEHLMARRRFAEAAELGHVLLRSGARDVYAMVKCASAYGAMVQSALIDKPPGLLSPGSQRARRLFDDTNRLLFARAEALGWAE